MTQISDHHVHYLSVYHRWALYYVSSIIVDQRKPTYTKTDIENIRLGIGEPPQLPTHVSESPGAPPPQAELVSPNQTWWFDMITLEWRVIVINQTKHGIKFHVITDILVMDIEAWCWVIMETYHAMQSCRAIFPNQNYHWCCCQCCLMMINAWWKS